MMIVGEIVADKDRRSLDRRIGRGRPLSDI